MENSKEYKLFRTVWDIAIISFMIMIVLAVFNKVPWSLVLAPFGVALVFNVIVGAVIRIYERNR